MTLEESEYKKIYRVMKMKAHSDKSINYKVAIMVLELEEYIYINYYFSATGTCSTGDVNLARFSLGYSSEFSIL